MGQMTHAGFWLHGGKFRKKQSLALLEQLLLYFFREVYTGETPSFGTVAEGEYDLAGAKTTLSRLDYTARNHLGGTPKERRSCSLRIIGKIAIY